MDQNKFYLAVKRGPGFGWGMTNCVTSIASFGPGGALGTTPQLVLLLVPSPAPGVFQHRLGP